ncbi:hypothetical protein HK405_011243 [Cladochytrium tenue]|nr:hypothetical protein HK405_011243 [Cladochytrium tenue]
MASHPPAPVYRSEPGYAAVVTHPQPYFQTVTTRGPPASTFAPVVPQSLPPPPIFYIQPPPQMSAPPSTRPPTYYATPAPASYSPHSAASKDYSSSPEKPAQDLQPPVVAAPSAAGTDPLASPGRSLKGEPGSHSPSIHDRRSPSGGVQQARSAGEVNGGVQAGRGGAAHSGPRPYRCPLDGCRSIFSRRYNMVQHFRGHAQRIGASMEAIERGARALKSSPASVTPFVATTTEVLRLSRAAQAAAAAALVGAPLHYILQQQQQTTAHSSAPSDGPVAPPPPPAQYGDYAAYDGRAPVAPPPPQSATTQWAPECASAGPSPAASPASSGPPASACEGTAALT